MKNLIILIGIGLVSSCPAVEPVPRKVLFFDLWKLDSWENVELRQGEPTWVGDCDYRDPAIVDGGIYFPSVWIDEASGKWRMIYSVKWSPLTMMIATSEDGVSWEPLPSEDVDPGEKKLASHHLLTVRSGSGGGIYHDPLKTDGYAFRIFARQSGDAVFQRALADSSHQWHAIAESEGEKRYIEEGITIVSKLDVSGIPGRLGASANEAVYSAFEQDSSECRGQLWRIEIPVDR